MIGGERSGWTAFAGFAGFDAYRETPPSPAAARAAAHCDLHPRAVHRRLDLVAGVPLVRGDAAGVAPAAIGAAQRPPEVRSRQPANNAHHGAQPDCTGEFGSAEIRSAAPGDRCRWPRARRIVLMGALFALFAAALSVQPVWLFTSSPRRRPALLHGSTAAAAGDERAVCRMGVAQVPARRRCRRRRAAAAPARGPGRSTSPAPTPGESYAGAAPVPCAVRARDPPPLPRFHPGGVRLPAGARRAGRPGVRAGVSPTARR